MGVVGTVYLAIQGILFVFWAVLIFRALIGLTRRSLAATRDEGGSWFVHNLHMFFGYFVDPSVAGERRRLIGVTVLLILVTLGSVFVIGIG